MFNKKIFTVFIFTVFCFSFFQKLNCASKSVSFSKKVGIICTITGKLALTFGPDMLGAYCADKILNKSEYYHNKMDKKIRTLTVGLGGLNLAIPILYALSLCIKKDKRSTNIVSEEERNDMFLLISPVIILMNYYGDKILNGNEYYHTKIDPYVKKTCLITGGCVMFHISTALTMGLLRLFAQIS